VTKVTQAHVDARTAAILDAALANFARKGVDRTTVQDIAADAGLSAGAIYRYFPGKEELLHAVFERAMAMHRRMFEEAAASESPLKGLLAVGREALGEMLHRDIACVDLEMTLACARGPGGFVPEQRELRHLIIDLIERQVAVAQDAGEIAADLDARTLAIVLNAFVLGVGSLALELGDEIDAAGALALVGDVLARTARPTA